MKHTDPINRAVLLLIGLLLVAIGAYGSARGLGMLGDALSAGVVLTSTISDFVARNSAWLWPLVAVAGLLLAYLGWHWLLAQFPAPQQVRTLDLPSQGPGSTRIKAAGAAQAWAKDVRRHRAVSSSRAWFQPDLAGSHLEMRVTVLDNDDFQTARSYVEGEAFDRLRLSLDMQALEAHVVVRLQESSERFLE